DLVDLQLAAIALRAQTVDVTLVLANEVASRSPDREADVERLRSARFDLELHLRTTRFRLLNPEGVRVHEARSLLPGDEARDLLFIGGVRGKLEVARVCCLRFGVPAHQDEDHAHATVRGREGGIRGRDSGRGLRQRGGLEGWEGGYGSWRCGLGGSGLRRWSFVRWDGRLGFLR